MYIAVHNADLNKYVLILETNWKEFYQQRHNNRSELKVELLRGQGKIKKNKRHLAIRRQELEFK